MIHAVALMSVAWPRKGMPMPARGSYAFDTEGNGALVDNAANLDKGRALFRDDRGKRR